MLKNFIKFTEPKKRRCYSASGPSHDDTDEYGYTKMDSLLSLSSSMSSSSIDKIETEVQFTPSQVEVLKQIFQKLKMFETRKSSLGVSSTMTKHEQPDLGYLMQQPALTDSM